MSKRTCTIAIALAALGCGVAPVASQAAKASPAWQLSLTALPTNFTPGSTGTQHAGPMLALVATNIGGAPSEGTTTLQATLPSGLLPIGPIGANSTLDETISPNCAPPVGQVVTCTTEKSVLPSRWIDALIPLEVSGALAPGEVLGTIAVVSGGGGETITTSAEAEIEEAAPPFDFLPGKAGLNALLLNDDGSAATKAGSHPGQLTIDIGFPIAEPAPGTLSASGHPRVLLTELPQGFVGNPTATEERCTEAELISGTPSESGCPDASQIGVVTAMTQVGNPYLPPTPLYNMVPPPGTPAELGFNAVNADIYVHLEGEVRSDGDFGISTRTDEIIARTLNPIMSVQAQVWGDPSAHQHDGSRGHCRFGGSVGKCEVALQSKPFLTLPSTCSDELPIKVGVKSWEEDFFHERTAAATDLFGNPIGINGCSALEFEPSLTLRPDTFTAESPTGVHIDLHVPQNDELVKKVGEEEVPQRATSTLKDTTLTLPEGMAINPAAAGGLEACTTAQIGYQPSGGQIHFSKDRPQCPAASKVGIVRVHTPLLDHPVPGAVYVAAPYDNPFGTLLAVYVVIDDPADGIVVKLAGKTEADRITGQLTTSFTEAPELPFEDFEVELFNGPRSVLRTPSTCGTFSTTSVQTPWSGTAPVSTVDSFQVSRGANGGRCASSEAQLPNSPGFEAGTQTPLAGSYSPLLSRLSREDGTQQLTGLDMTFPPGLTGKLAGIETCPDAAITAASSRSGQEELAHPSCPQGSQIGEVRVGAGAGPTPYYTTGKIYLAGPYKGAPISGVVITPAVAGPFDLGTVVVRAAGHIDSATAQLTISSDSFPHILEGIPLELRDARVSLSRRNFTLNPTSCAQMAIAGQATSLLGGTAPLSERFQVGGCRGLSYTPKLFIRLRGGTGRGAHPRLRAVLETAPGEANTARTSVTLPHSEFLENAHIQTVCTRVQFAAHQCPDGSIYGHAKAFTPLLDEPLEGPVYLRSSSHELPDMVAAMHGPPSRPIEVELDGRIDSVHGSIRSTFEAVPDQPVSKFILNMQGGRKGLLVNSRNLCKRIYRATAKFDGQNGKTHDFRPKVKASCTKPRKPRHRQP